MNKVAKQKVNQSRVAIVVLDKIPYIKSEGVVSSLVSMEPNFVGRRPRKNS